jgi:transcriptional antiterminator RfaH
MPILSPEATIYPDQLLDLDSAADSAWWAMYTLPRQEKKLMRILVEKQIGFYCPMIKRRYRSPNGRLRCSTQPLFGGYVFVCGDEANRYDSLSTGCISRCLDVPNSLELVQDLRQVQGLIAQDAPLSPERRMEPGQRVRIRSGAFAGYEGIIIRREKEVRLQVSVRFMDQGVSVLLNDCQADLI